MPNPLFEPKKPTNHGGGIFEMIYNKMYQSNPAFRDLANSAKGKSLEQVYSEYGHDYNRYKGMSENDIAQMLSKNGML